MHKDRTSQKVVNQRKMNFKVCYPKCGYILCKTFHFFGCYQVYRYIFSSCGDDETQFHDYREIKNAKTSAIIKIFDRPLPHSNDKTYQYLEHRVSHRDLTIKVIRQSKFRKMGIRTIFDGVYLALSSCKVSVLKQPFDLKWKP